MAPQTAFPQMVLLPDEVRLVRRVFDRVKAMGVLARSPLRQEAFAANLLDMYFRGMVIEDSLYGLGLAAARARFGDRRAATPGNTPVRKVLIVEDDYFHATEIKDAFIDAGALVLGPFANEHDALCALDSEVPDFAIVDLNLGDGPTFNVAEYLSEQSIPICVVSAYRRSELKSVPDNLAAIPWIEEPASPEAIVEIVSRNMR